MPSTLTAGREDGKLRKKIEIISIFSLFIDFLLRLFFCFVFFVAAGYLYGAIVNRAATRLRGALRGRGLGGQCVDVVVNVQVSVWLHLAETLKEFQRGGGRMGWVADKA